MKFGKLSLNLWADLHGYDILWLERQDRRAYVDKVPSQWFSPQWVNIPLWVHITTQEWQVYAQPDLSWMLDDRF